ncbi:hypothetical protein NQ317_009196 [Molorchus minor]|uniref:Uncharacterized protein n=1 Tax=Molorchus minor TaxID=1323400 RepID=A0ABQ9ISY1_9CUCU|nr:hypothetical protein NQ317_009196 [Molorchus minor]
MSDCGPKRTSNVLPWNVSPSINPQHHFHGRESRDTDSDGSIDIDLAQDLSNRSQKDGQWDVSKGRSARPSRRAGAVARVFGSEFFIDGAERKI